MSRSLGVARGQIGERNANAITGFDPLAERAWCRWDALMLTEPPPFPSGKTGEMVGRRDDRGLVIRQVNRQLLLAVRQVNSHRFVI